MMVKRLELIKLRGGRSKVEVSKFIGITPQMLGKIEQGERTPSLEVANKICKVYNVSLNDIFGD